MSATISQRASLSGQEAIAAELAERICHDSPSAGIVVCGPAGIGKSTIVASALDRIDAFQGYGKFDQSSSSSLEPVRHALRQALESYIAAQPLPDAAQAKIAADVGPLLGLIQGDMEASSAPSLLNRLLEGALAACTAISRGGRPVVLAIEDLHWADRPALALLDKLLRFGPKTGFFVVGSSRTDDVRLDAERLVVPPLEVVDATALVASRVGGDEGLARNIVRLLGDERTSNAFKLCEALQSLESSSELRRDDEGTWRLAEIEAIGPRLDNRVAALDGALAQLLAIAARLGHRFARAELVFVAEELIDSQPIAPLIDSAVAMGFFGCDEHDLWFVHDLYREAARGLLPEAQSRHVHRIASEFFRHRRASGGTLQDAVRFATHALAAQTESTDPSHVTLMADAAESALSLDDPQGALRIARYGLQQATASPPSAARAAVVRLCLVVYKTASREEATGHEGTIVAAANTPMDIAEAYGAIATRWFESGENGKAVEAIRSGLSTLGIGAPKKVGRLAAAASVARTWFLAPAAQRLRGNVGTSRRALADAEAYLIEKGVPALYSSELHLSAHLRSRAALHQLAANGTRSFSTSSGMTVTSAAAGNLSQARRWARRTLDTIPSAATYGRASALYRATFFGEIWRVPFHTLTEVNRQVVKEALAEGDTQYAAYGARNLVQCLWFAGDDLERVAVEADAVASLLTRLGDVGNRRIVEATRQAIASLRSDPASTLVVDGPLCSAAAIDELAQMHNWDAWCMSKIVDLQLRVAAGDLTAAHQIVQQVASRERNLRGTLMHAFFCALATVTYARALDLDRAKAAARILRQYARNCPDAFSHLHELAAAEIALAQGLASAASYERAAQTATALGRHFDRALIHQLAASALDAARTRDEARRHAEEARIIWRQLGVMRLARPPAEASGTIPVDALVAIAAAETLDDACQRAADAAAAFCCNGVAVALQVDEGWKNWDAAVANDAQRQRLRTAIGGYSSGTPVAEDVSVVTLQVGDVRTGVIATTTLPDEATKDRLAKIAPLIAPILDRARLAAELARARTDLGTELKSAQNEAALSAARERKATMDMSTFLATISHELRSPLSAIGALIETSSQASDPLSQEQALALRGAFLSLRTLADDLLDAGRADRDEPAIRSQAFNPKEVARAAARLMSDEHASETRPLTTDIAQVATSVRGDPQRLQQILVNLLSNAYRHAHEGAVHLEARFVEQRDGVRCSYAVEDEGPGVAEVPNLFESFARSSTSPGVGLGLAVSRQLATALGGTLTAANRSPTGSRFVLELVLPTASAARGPTPQLGPIHVLLVDDLQLTRVSYAKLLGIEGWQVDTAESGERALEMMSVRTYDLVLIDFLLPGWDGLETLRRIDELMPDRSKRPPLILFTALPSTLR